MKINDRGIAQRGLLIRHLILPNKLSGTENITHFIASRISKSSYLNVMDQYRPCYKASQTGKYPELNHRPSLQAYQNAVHFAKKAGLNRLDG